MEKLKKYRDFLLEEEEPEITYSFEELSPDAQRKVLEDYYDINIDRDDWSEPIIEGFKEDMEELGLSNVGVEYTGFHSQGDGASFTANVSDVEKFLKEALGKKSDQYLDLGEELKDENSYLRKLKMGLYDLGFDNRERLTPENFDISIRRISSRYSHENTIESDVDIYDVPESMSEGFDQYQYASEIGDEVTEWARGKSKELYSDLSKYYEELTSEEEIKETILANDYTFDEEGNTI
jgi:hypothetical protein